MPLYTDIVWRHLRSSHGRTQYHAFIERFTFSSCAMPVNLSFVCININMTFPLKSYQSTNAHFDMTIILCFIFVHFVWLKCNFVNSFGIQYIFSHKTFWLRLLFCFDYHLIVCQKMSIFTRFLWCLLLALWCLIGYVYCIDGNQLMWVDA